jgi:hypothetical protein
MIDDTAIAFTPRPMQDFGAQISGLEEQINNLMEQMGVLEAEKNDALQQQDVMRAELAQAQQDALTEQASEFEGVKSSLEQQIADLTAQIGSMQEPTIMKDAPVPPRDEQIFVPPKTIADIDAPRDVVTTRTQPLQKLPLGPKREDFMSIDRLGGSAMDRMPPMPDVLTPRSPSIPPMTPPMTPRPRPRPVPEPIPSPLQQAFEKIQNQQLPMLIESANKPKTNRYTGKPFAFDPNATSVKMPQPMTPNIPMDMTMMGGARGGFLGAMRPMMMRAGGGGISKAIVDLESKLR